MGGSKAGISDLVGAGNMDREGTSGMVVVERDACSSQISMLSFFSIFIVLFIFQLLFVFFPSFPISISGCFL